MEHRGCAVRDWALKWAGTVLFIVWEAGLRIRGKWRRNALRDWLNGRNQ